MCCKFLLLSIVETLFLIGPNKTLRIAILTANTMETSDEGGMVRHNAFVIMPDDDTVELHSPYSQEADYYITDEKSDSSDTGVVAEHRTVIFRRGDVDRRKELINELMNEYRWMITSKFDAVALWALIDKTITDIAQVNDVSFDSLLIRRYNIYGTPWH